MKLVSRFIRSIGVFLIVLISASSIILSYFTRDIPDNSPVKQYLNLITNAESRFYDFRMQGHIKNNKEDKTSVLIKVDDESLQKLGTWPINRNTWATMLDNLDRFGAKVVTFDVLFPEEVKSCGIESPDDVFAKSIQNFQAKDNKRVILAYTAQSVETNTPSLPEIPGELFANIAESRLANENITFSPKLIEAHTWPIQKLLDTEPDLGFLNMESDNDGVFRHYQVVANIESMFFPSLGYRSYMAYTENNPTISIDNNGIAEIDFAKKRLQLNGNGETKIKWVGGSEKFQEISLHRVVAAKDFIEHTITLENTYGVAEDHPFTIFEKDGESYIELPSGDKVVRSPVLEKDGIRYIEIEGRKEIIKTKNYKLDKLFKDKIVYIGSTATGAHDLRNTPINPQLPGIYAHMNFVNMLLSKNFYKDEGQTLKYTLYIFSISITLLIIIMFFNHAIIDLAYLLISCLVIFTIDYMYFIPQGYELKLFFTLFGILSTYSWVTFLNFNQASAEKKQIKGAFSRYVAPSIVDDMLDNPDKLKVGGERKDITCMFSDVRDFTSISEMLTPTELAMALNRYMGEMTDIVFDTNGTLDKYIGDAIVAFWGAPLDIGDHVNQAVNAGVLMIEALPAINAEFKEKNLPEFKIGLGLNSGECSVGNMGSDQIFAYTALGDTMNLGARLESLCKYYGAQILVSEYTFARMDQEKFTTRLIDNVVVKGKTEPVGVYEVLYSYHAFMIDKEALVKFKEAFDLFLNGKFFNAKKIFDELSIDHPADKASLRMKETCERWIKTPPEDGEDFRVTTMTTKG
jgi:adenylate cyclase